VRFSSRNLFLAD